MMKYVHRCLPWLAPTVLAVGGVVSAGCGLDNSLICGATCDPDARFGVVDNDASNSAADAPVDSTQQVDSPQQGESGKGDDAEASDSTTGRVDDGAIPMDSPVKDSGDSGRVEGGSDGGRGVEGGSDGGCQVCGQATCCAPLLQCAVGGISCCSVLGGSCGAGDHGSPCCSGLVCTTALQCAASCKTTGACATQSDCCLGASYCDVGTASCTVCRALNAPCTLHDQCCSGSCSGTTLTCVGN